MSAFDLDASLKNAERRLGADRRETGRRPRSDRGRSRVDARVLAWLAEALSEYERPAVADVVEGIGVKCRKEGLRPPSRATVYKLLDRLPPPAYRVAELPRAVRDALYNLTSESVVPGHQVAFYCFNYGDLAAVSFAAGLPWLALHQARRLPGHRARSRGLLEAVARARGL